MTHLQPLSGFPYLTRDEFTAACRALVAKVDTFLQREVDLAASLGWTGVRLERKDDEVLLIIHKQLDNEEPTLPLHLKQTGDTLKINEVAEEEENDDDNDPEELIRQPCCGTKSQVEYNIMLSPTYRVPVLYFFLHNTVNNSSSVSAKGPEGLDVIYDRLVPTQYKSELKSIGIMGGLSIGHHPLSDIPVYFVHPCNTPDALRDVAGNKETVVTTETYLLLWLGLVGNCIGLHVPSELLIERQNP